MKSAVRILLVVAGISLAGHAAAAPFPGTVAAWTLARPLLDASLALFRFGASPAVRQDGAKVTRDEGRRVLQFPVGKTTPALFVDVHGDVEFERADIGLPDGTVESVDAFAVRRDTGLFELATYPDPRRVEWVRLVLRARSRQARVGVVIGV